MVRWTYFVVRVAPYVFFLGALLSFALLLYTLTLTDQLTSREYGDAIYEGLVETVAGLAMAAYAFWFHRLVAHTFPEVN